jgi:DNA-binding CsgD family transcriptional regulator
VQPVRKRRIDATDNVSHRADETGKALFVTPNAVRTHLDRTRDKTGTRNVPN